VRPDLLPGEFLTQILWCRRSPLLKISDLEAVLLLPQPTTVLWWCSGPHLPMVTGR